MAISPDFGRNMHHATVPSTVISTADCTLILAAFTSLASADITTKRSPKSHFREPPDSGGSVRLSAFSEST